jgi:DNA-binding LytR/AlgR family response regulator
LIICSNPSKKRGSAKLCSARTSGSNKRLARNRNENLHNATRNLRYGARNEPLERIPVKKRDEIYLVPVAEIASIVADGELLHITTDKNQKYVVNYRLKDLEMRLDEKRFVRLSRGALVNSEMIARVAPMPGGTYLIVLKNGQEIASSRQQSKILRLKLLKL